MVSRRKKRVTKKTKAKKRVSRKPPVKAKAKRTGKALVKALKPARRAPAKKKKASRPRPHKAPKKLVRRKLGAKEELQVHALIARVYQKAAEEMRRLEESANETKAQLMRHAAQELVHLEAMAKKFT